MRALVAIAGGLGVLGWLRGRRIPLYPEPDSLIVEPATPASAQRIEPGSIRLRWQREGERVRVYSGSSPETINRSQPLAEIMGTREIILEGFAAQTRSFFELEFDDGHLELVAERFLPLSSIANLRDLGGYPNDHGQQTRWNRVFRSASLAYASSEDLAQLEALGIRFICDLRTTEETAEDPDRLPASADYLHAPAHSDTNRMERLRVLLFKRRRLIEFMQHLYIHSMLEENASAFGDALRPLADPDNLPAIIHCAAGKDRAGLAAALLLRTLGVAEEIVIADYTLSNHFYEYFRTITRKVIRPLAYFGIREEELIPLLTAHPENIRAALEYLEAQYGGVNRYLVERAGLTHETLLRLRENLLL